MIRKATIKDIKRIHRLINHFAKADLMLPRSLNAIYENIRDFWVAEENKRITGCVALHVCWDYLAEIKSLAVKKKWQNNGLGKELIDACLKDAKILGAKKVFALTYKPDFFKKFGFKKVKHTDLPHKVWAECINCPKFPNCKETALVRKI